MNCLKLHGQEYRLKELSSNFTRQCCWDELTVGGLRGGREASHESKVASHGSRVARTDKETLPPASLRAGLRSAARLSAPVLGPLSLSPPSQVTGWQNFLPDAKERANIVQISTARHHRSGLKGLSRKI